MAAAAHITSCPQAAALEALTHSFQALVLSLVSCSKIRLSVDAVAQFMVSLLASLPSSSAQDPRHTLNAILIDVIWTVDVGLEDSLPSTPSKAELAPEAKAAYDDDKRILASFVKALVVRESFSCILIFHTEIYLRPRCNQLCPTLSAGKISKWVYWVWLVCWTMRQVSKESRFV